MASFIYYGLNKSIVSDDQFDKWCLKLSKNFHKLDRFRQWQLGSAEEIRASGFHVKLTHATIGGALSWMIVMGMEDLRPVVYTRPWHTKMLKNKKEVAWLYPENFQYQELSIVQGKPKRKRTRL